MQWHRDNRKGREWRTSTFNVPKDVGIIRMEIFPLIGSVFHVHAMKVRAEFDTEPSTGAATRPAASATSGQATQPASAGPATSAAVDAAKLVEEVRQSEQWVHEAKSFYLRFKSAWINSPQVIARRAAELKKDWPDEEVDANHFPELRPRIDLVVEMAFDQTRMSASTGAISHRRGSRRPCRTMRLFPKRARCIGTRSHSISP